PSAPQPPESSTRSGRSQPGQRIHCGTSIGPASTVNACSQSGHTPRTAGTRPTPWNTSTAPTRPTMGSSDGTTRCAIGSGIDSGTRATRPFSAAPACGPQRAIRGSTSSASAATEPRLLVGSVTGSDTVLDLEPARLVAGEHPRPVVTGVGVEGLFGDQRQIE